MSTATAIAGFGMTLGDYEPATADGRNLLRLAWNNKSNYLKGSAIDWLPTIDAAIAEIRANCGSDNWDGADAYAVADATLELAAKVAQSLFSILPKGTPAPDLVPEADGEIGISWNVDPDHVFSLSVGPHNKINFAGQFGKEGGIHGWHPIDASSSADLSESLEEVARHVGRLYPTIATRRVAR